MKKTVCCFFIVVTTGLLIKQSFTKKKAPSQRDHIAEKFTVPAVPVFNPAYSPMKRSADQADAVGKLQRESNEALPRQAEGQRYCITRNQLGNEFAATNPGNNLQFTISEKGFTVQPLNSGQLSSSCISNLKTGINNWKIGFTPDQAGWGKVTGWITQQQTVFCNTEKVSVQYSNTAEGMRQNFIVHQPLQQEGLLRIKCRLTGNLQPQINKSGIRFTGKDGNTLMNYNGLCVWDANGMPLPAWFEKETDGFSIITDDARAQYPVTIDPVSSTPTAVLQGNSANVTLGAAVASAGDVNGDGYSDVVVGAPNYSNGQPAEGAIYFYPGSSSGISNTPAIILESNKPNSLLGSSVSTAGDVNGDGYSDVVAGASSYTNGEAGEGALYIYYGSPAGLSPTPSVIIESNASNASLGNAVACAGDIDKDGYSDIIAGVSQYTNGQNQEGAIYIYYGSAAGINLASLQLIESNLVSANLGFAVSSAGDIDADGYYDVVAGAPHYENGQSAEGAAFIFKGSAARLIGTPYLVLERNNASAEFGNAVAAAGDVNGDGYSDVVIGSHTYSNGQAQEGAAFLYLGNVSGLNTGTVQVLETNRASSRFGESLACAGDINGDGYSDLVAGATGYNQNNPGEGAMYVYYGNNNGYVSTPAVVAEGQGSAYSMGISVASAGDVNGDGFSDIICGVPGYSNGQTMEGAAYLFAGAARNLNTINPPVLNGNPQTINSMMGESVAMVGDINGDGYDDFAVGAPAHYGSSGAVLVYYGRKGGLSVADTLGSFLPATGFSIFYGFAVAPAGDVNGDGYADLVTIAAFSQHVYVHYGSPTGITQVPAADIYYTGPGGITGIGELTSGDFNGDGYSDLALGDSYGPSGTQSGRVFIYNGSPTGIHAAAPDLIIEDQNNQGILVGSVGYRISNAGDVNGDGYDDLMAVAPYNSYGQTVDAGVVYLFYGSATGLATLPYSILGTDDFNQSYSNYGATVAGLGDVNGDGYDDIGIAAPTFSPTGRVYVYYGSATGITVNSNQFHYDCNYCTVFRAGDLNKDGYNDLVLGDYNYGNGSFSRKGRIMVFPGSASGMQNTPYVTGDPANENDAVFGLRGVYGGGDINGDGIADLVAGASQMTLGGGGTPGQAFVLFGNDSANGRTNYLRLYEPDLTSPIKPGTINSNFGAGLFASSFLGKQQAKMVWETRVSFGVFGGSNITNSVSFSGQQAVYTNMAAGGTELKNLVPKISTALYTKIRARVKYNPVTAITGQVYGPWRYPGKEAFNEILRTLPLELLSFSASWQQKGKTALLRFSTEKENGSCCFDVEKSNDGVHFAAIGTIPAKNNTGIQQYQFTDNNATAARQYYRLKIIDIDGKFTYSNIQLLQYSGSTDVFLFPNPAIDEIKLQLNNTVTAVRIQLINASGQIVQQFTRQADAGQTIRIPVQKLPAGTYWLSLQQGADKQTMQFIKQ